MDAIVSVLPKGDIADAVVVANPSLDTRPLRAVLADGTVLSTGDIIAPLSVSIFDRAALKPAGLLHAKADRLENEHLAVVIGADGAVQSLVHKATGREALAEPANQLWIYPVDKPRNWDAWDIDADYPDKGVRLDRPESIELVENGAHRVAIKVVYRYRDSTVVQHYALTANAKRLDIETHIDWHDRRTLLRSLSPVATRARTATFECAYGIVNRPTHTNTSWDAAMFEAVAHRFIDLSEPDFGVALLNDAKYGHSARANVLGISLVRGPIYPDPLADEGEQRFTYALYPHAGEWHSGGVREEADDLNQPLIATGATNVAEATLTPIVVTGTPVALSAIKPAEEGNGLVLRVYEPAGRRGGLSIAPAHGWRVSEAVNLMEEPAKRDVGADILPFEVRSWKLTRA